MAQVLTVCYGAEHEEYLKTKKQYSVTLKK